MSKIDLLRDILKRIQAVTPLIDSTIDLEKELSKIADDECDIVVEKVKSVIGNITDSICCIKKDIYLLDVKHSRTNSNGECDLGDKSCTSNEKLFSLPEMQDLNKEINRTDVSVDDIKETSEHNTQDTIQSVNRDSDHACGSVDTEDRNEALKNKTSNSGSSENFDKSLLASELKEVSSDVEVNKNTSEYNKEADLKPPLIKLVDINKLVEPGKKTFDFSQTPKENKSVKFDSSVIVLDSSDEDSNKKSISKKNGNKHKITPSTKIIKKYSSKSIKENDLVLTGSDSSSSETCEGDSNSRKSRMSVNKEKQKEKFLQLKTAIMKRKRCSKKKADSERSSKESSSDEKLKKVAKKGPPGKSQFIRTKEKMSSNGTSSSDSGNSNGEEQIKKPDNLETTSKLFVPLPKVECEKLPELCKRKRNIFSVQCSRSVKNIHPLKCDVENDTTSEKDKPKTKKSRTIKVSKTNLSDKTNEIQKSNGKKKPIETVKTNNARESGESESDEKIEDAKSTKCLQTTSNISKSKDLSNSDSSDKESKQTSKSKTTRRVKKTDILKKHKRTDTRKPELENDGIVNDNTKVDENYISAEENDGKNVVSNTLDNECEIGENEAELGKTDDNASSLDKTDDTASGFDKTDDNAKNKEKTSNIDKKESTDKKEISESLISPTISQSDSDNYVEHNKNNRKKFSKSNKNKSIKSGKKSVKKNTTATDKCYSSDSENTDVKNEENEDDKGSNRSESISKKDEELSNQEGIIIGQNNFTGKFDKSSDTKLSEIGDDESDSVSRRKKSKSEPKKESDLDVVKRNKVASKEGSTKTIVLDSDSEKEENAEKALKEKNNSSDSDENFSSFCKRKDKSRNDVARKAKRNLQSKKLILDSESENSERISDESDNTSSIGPKKDKSREKVKKKIKKSTLISDSEEDYKEDESDNKSCSSSSSEKEEEEEVVNKKTKKSRIKRTKDSSSDDEDKSTRKQIRRVIDRNSLSETTKKAEAAEKERKARIAEKQKKYNQIFDLKMDTKIEKLILDYNEDTKEPVLEVDQALVKKLKPHQASGIQFMWDACFESVKRTEKTEGSGCILAHCMGLGKTLQVIVLAHTLLTNYEKTKITKVMVVCPVNTVLNWRNEFKKWLHDDEEYEVFELVSCKKNIEREYRIKDWHENGGVLIIGYAMFRTLTGPENKKLTKKMRKVFQEGLVDPGPDLVICDEGHLLKNEKTSLSVAMNRIRSLRRIVLTGTPLQNNLKEYWCMVQFIKPNLLGTYKEYLNRFVNPITNGQYTDSTLHDIQIMRRRSHVLHKLLDGVVQRRDYSVLEPYLPPKYEYVVFIPLSEVQVKLYKHYMENLSGHQNGSTKTSFIFVDFQEFQRICTHPRVLLSKSLEDDNKKEQYLSDEEDEEGSLKDFIDDGSESESTSSDGATNSDESDESIKSQKKSRRTRYTRSQAAEKRVNGEKSDDSDIEEVKELKEKQWWREFCDGDELENIANSSKMLLLFELLKECEQIGDKILIFSQSLYTLNCIEYFLAKIDEATQAGSNLGGYSGSWALGLDYFRLDGSSSCDNRASWCDSFNDPKNIRARLFLISTRAGGLGINLVAANRVIIFDVSWNPSHDTQSIYRVYRFGQTKPCYIYRFVTYGAMEMKIYERQVTKQAISKRVIDEQQIDRHYSQNDIQELYKCDLEPEDRPIPLVPKDVLLGEMVQKHEKVIYKYHLHQSLLENKEDEVLNEEERKAAWEEFENEKIQRSYSATMSTMHQTVSNINNAVLNMKTISNPIPVNPTVLSIVLAEIIKKDNPGWSEQQIRPLVPALITQMQAQVRAGDLTLYLRVQAELKALQMQSQQARDHYLQQQAMMKMIQQQQQQAAMIGDMNVYLGSMFGRTNPMMFANQVRAMPSGSVSTGQPTSNDVIDLND